MKRWMYLALSLPCFIASFWLIAAAWPVHQPDLFTEKAVIHLGDLSQGQKAVVEFVLVNHFSQPLEIVDVVRSCTCSEATPERNHLEPNGRTVLRVAWSTGSYRGLHTVNVSVVFKLADGEAGARSLQVEGNIVPDIITEPGKLVFDGTKAETQSLHLRAGRIARFKVSSARCNHRAFTASLGENGVVDVTFDGRSPVYANGIEPMLILANDGPNEPNIMVPLELRAPRPSQ